MAVDNVFVLISAAKRSVAFPDDLVKEMAGLSLVQRAINLALQITGVQSNVCVVTDLEEVAQTADRNGICSWLEYADAVDDMRPSIGLYRYLRKKTKSSVCILILSPYAPLLERDTVESAIFSFYKSDYDILKPYRQELKSLVVNQSGNVLELLTLSSKSKVEIESSAFVLVKTEFIKRRQKPKVSSWRMRHDFWEIGSLQDWWICEKLLNRKRVILRVVGNTAVGLGHIYRALSMASEFISSHEVLFVCDINSEIAAEELIGSEYRLEVFSSNEVVNGIIDLDPDIVINDILSTSVNDVSPLQQHGIKVVNFEDLGEGAVVADMVFNELYDNPIISGKNIFWGYRYFFVRDEFKESRSHRFRKNVTSLLLSFGGTDQHDLTWKIYMAIRSICRKENVIINIVTGPGYRNFDKLQEEILLDNHATLTRATGVISSIMETTQLAICSNGRTIYELAHMNIPAIVISAHDREKTHSFACEENGYIKLNTYNNSTKQEAVDALKRLLFDAQYRHMLFDKTKKFRFHKNKERVLKKIYALMEE